MAKQTKTPKYVEQVTKAIVNFDTNEEARTNAHNAFVGAQASQLTTMITDLKQCGTKLDAEKALSIYAALHPAPVLEEKASTAEKDAHKKAQRAWADRAGLVSKAIALITNKYTEEAASVKAFVSNGRDVAKEKGLWTVRDTSAKTTKRKADAEAKAKSAQAMTLPKIAEFLASGINASPEGKEAVQDLLLQMLEKTMPVSTSTERMALVRFALGAKNELLQKGLNGLVESGAIGTPRKAKKVVAEKVAESKAA